MLKKLLACQIIRNPLPFDIGVSIEKTNSCSYSTLITAVWYSISCFIGPRYNGSRHYLISYRELGAMYPIYFIWHSDRFLNHGTDRRHLHRCRTAFVSRDDVIKWKHFPRYWPFVRGIQRSPVNSPHKGQWRRALMFSVIYAWINGWANNREAGDLRRHRVHYDVIVKKKVSYIYSSLSWRAGQSVRLPTNWTSRQSPVQCGDSPDYGVH